MKSSFVFTLILLLGCVSALGGNSSDKAPQAFNLEIFQEFKDSVRQQAVRRGNEGGHGGDSYVLEFVTLGKLVSAGLESFTSQTLRESHFTREAFEQVVTTVKVSSHGKEEMFLEGKEVDAINFPQANQIKINRDRWREHSLESRIQLVMHEYFGILGVERDNYSVTLKFLSFIQMLSKEVARYENLSVNLFYGQCNVFPSLSSGQICNEGSNEIREAQLCSVKKAQAKCVIADKDDCKIISTTMSPVLSTRYVGLRFCEVLTIAK